MKCKICGKNINNPTKYFSVKDRAHLHWLTNHRKTHRPKSNLFQEFFVEKAQPKTKGVMIVCKNCGHINLRKKLTEFIICDGCGEPTECEGKTSLPENGEEKQ